MPELPDITVYLEALQPRVIKARLLRARMATPFILRSVDPAIDAIEGRRVTHLRRLGKRIVLGFEEEFFLVIHLMIAGRLHWSPQAPKGRGRNLQAAFEFDTGALTLTEAGTQKRASVHVVRGERDLAAHDPGGLDVFHCSHAEFRDALLLRNRTLKRALTDPGSFDGIGNAYSDEILHRARLSPIALTRRLSKPESDRLLDACRRTLAEWIARLRDEAHGDFPEGVTAFRPEMAVHGKFKQPCPVCGVLVQRIVRAENEVNYCPGCQTGGRVLRDRSLSRLLGDDWPSTA